MTTSIELRDFQPINQWEECPERLRPYSSIDPEQSNFEIGLIADESGRKYLHEPTSTIRWKCFGLSLTTPIIQVLAAAFNIIKIALRLIFFWHFWPDSEAEQPYSFKANLLNTGKDLLRIVATPLAIVGLEAAVIYGMISPNDGRKLYATIERAMYDTWRLAPCFQPNIQPNSLPLHSEKRAF